MQYLLTLDLALHELTKGLGVFTSLTNYRHDDGLAFVAPTVWQGDGVLYFEPMSAFDALLHVGNTSITKAANTLVTFPKARDLTIHDYLEYSAATTNQIYNMITSGNLVAQLDNSQIPIYRSSLLDNENCDFVASLEKENELEFVVSSSPKTMGRKLDGELKLRNMNRVYGPKTLQILSQIGYKTVDSKPKLIKFKVSPTFRTSTYEPIDGDVYDDDYNGTRLMDTFSVTEDYKDCCSNNDLLEPDFKRQKIS